MTKAEAEIKKQKYVHLKNTIWEQNGSKMQMKIIDVEVVPIIEIKNEFDAMFDVGGQLGRFYQDIDKFIITYTQIYGQES